MTLSVLRISVSACLLAMTTVTHAATPITLPFGDFGLQGGSELELPLPPPPPPQVTRPDVTQMRLVIKRQPVQGGCTANPPRMTSERRQVAASAEARRLRLG